MATSAGGIDHNAHDLAKRWRGAAAALNGELAQSLAWLAPRVTVTMREEAPKFRSTLTNSIEGRRENALSYFIAPSTAYAVYVHKGRRPGKGLPRFYDPASASLQAWLEETMARSARAQNPKWRKAKVGSKRRTAYEQELRDRYMALSRHVKAHGIKPNPFVTRTAEQWRSLAPATLRAAVRRALDGRGLGGAMA